LKYLYRLFVPVVLLASLTAVNGCKKKEKPVPPSETAPTVSGPAPTAQITATPETISAGDQTVLSWRTTNADSITIEGIGQVPSSGVRNVQPTASTSYHLVARGSGGVADASARVTVTGAPAVSVPTTGMTDEQSFHANVQDVFFDYDTAEIRSDAEATLQKNAQYLNSHPEVRFIIGGYADERGSNEYNLALGQNRAEAVKNALVNSGIAASRIRVISFGKEKPFCTESTEECWQQNRRGGFQLER
jgi:peptidoglycan-associated lipoprotein